MNAAANPDVFEAARIVVKTIEPFKEKEDRKRIIRWAAETLSLPAPFAAVDEPSFAQLHGDSLAPVAEPSLAVTRDDGPADIRSFIDAKKPTSDMQFATAVAYFYQFVARNDERRDAIDKDILRDAFRKANRKQPKDCRFTLDNAVNAGLMDRTGQGNYSVNSVGENLVVMTLPSNTADKSARQSKKLSKRTAPARNSGRKQMGKAR